MPHPPTLLSMIVEPTPPVDRDKLVAALEQWATTDPGISWTLAGDTGQMLLHGQHELQLDTVIDSLRREFTIPLKVGAPQVAYRETITRRSRIDYTHKSRSREPAQFAQLSLLFEPQASGTGALFRNAIEVKALPQDYVTAIAEGLAAAKEHGVFVGFPCVDFMVTLMDGSTNEFSSREDFTAAAHEAFREGFGKAAPILLEPIMKCEVITSEDFLGDVIGDLNSRRGWMQSMDEKDAKRVVVASVPLATMFGYISKLRSMTHGQVDCLMEFSHFDRVPASGMPTPPNDSFPSAIGMRRMPYTFTKLDGNSGNGR